MKNTFTPKSAVIVKFTTKSGARKFTQMMKKAIKNSSLPLDLLVFIDKYHYENEII